MSESTEDEVLTSCQCQYSTAISLLERILKELVDGLITVRILNVLLETKHRKQLLAISDNLKDGFSGIQPVEGTKQSSLIETVLDWRKRELEEYQRQLKLLRSFMDSCRDVQSGKLFICNII